MKVCEQIIQEQKERIATLEKQLHERQILIDNVFDAFSAKSIDDHLWTVLTLTIEHNFIHVMGKRYYANYTSVYKIVSGFFREMEKYKSPDIP